MPVTDENYKDLGQTNYSYESHFGENEEKADTETQDNDHLNSHSRDHERNAITETRYARKCMRNCYATVQK